MDVNSELNLYNHVNFCAATNKPIGKSGKKGAKNQRKNGKFQNKAMFNSKSKAQQQNQKGGGKNFNNSQSKSFQGKNVKQNNSQSVQFKLSANELLFFPKNYNPRPDRIATIFPNDLVKKNDYMARVKNLKPNDQRKMRSKQDARNSCKKNKTEAENEGMAFCHDHLVGRCSRPTQCGRWHQLRPPKIIGVCKFYLSGCCTNGDSCEYMHEDYPCRFYHLGITHPKINEGESCQFMHGGPLAKRLRHDFRKNISMWVENMTQSKPKQFDSMLKDYMNKFEAKQAELEEEYGMQSNEISTETSGDDKFSIESILTSKQLKTLAEKNITTAAQINQVPIDDLIDFGLTMDQIYTITTNTCNDSDQLPTGCEDSVDACVNDDIFKSDIMLDSSCLMLDDSTNVMLNRSTEVDSKEIQLIDGLDTASLFNGFTIVETKEAEQMLQTKQNLLLGDLKQIDACPTSGEGNTTDEDAAISEIESEAKICQTEMAKPEQIDNSDDSDNEFSLIINEDI